MKSFLKPLLLFCALWLCTDAKLVEIINAKVVGVHDGDSITLLLDGNVELKVRLEGIDCPEKKQAFGNAAKQFTSDLAFDKLVMLQKTGVDRYGRTLGFIILPDGSNLNEEILKAGFAWHFKKYNQDPLLAQMEDTARINHKGLWQDPNPVPPWEFRKN
jgi:endonuclease YncB( thermonuclease family)